MSQRIVEVSREYDRSKGFLSGLYAGLLSLLILVSLGDRADLNQAGTEYIYHNQNLHLATNIYGILALAGAVLGFWRIWKWADKPRRLISLPSVWICIGLAVWVLAQALWVVDVKINGGDDPGIHDIAFVVADLCWLMALLQILKLVNKLLEGIGKQEIGLTPFVGILTAVLGLLGTAFLSLIHLSSAGRLKLGIDGLYILITFASLLLAVALANGKTAELPLPVQLCLRYLFVATIINALATVAFVLTDRLPANNRLQYADGNWIDWLFLTVMYCWSISALKCPIRTAEHKYTYSTTLTKVSGEDFYQARAITSHYLLTEPNNQRTFYLEHTKWIMDNIKRCWTIVKLGDLVVGSTFLFPVSHALINRFEERKITEREMFEEVMTNPLTWEGLYLADASILAQHRRRKLAFNCFKETIDWVVGKHKDVDIVVYCLPDALERTGLVEKLTKHFLGKVRVQIVVQHAPDDGIGGRL